MILKRKNSERIIALGLQLIPSNDEILFVKPKGLDGNFIPQWRANSANSIDCPCLRLRLKANSYCVHLSDWTPGPGPGDFNLKFDNEESAIDFIENYYFGANDFFEARKAYENYSRDSFNLSELKEMFDAVISKFSKEFSNNEVFYGDRGTYHKIPIDDWRITKFEEEWHSIKVTGGFLRSEVMHLREKILLKEELTYEEVNTISSLLFEISVLLKSKNNV